MRRLTRLILTALSTLGLAATAHAQTTELTPDESVLGEFVVTGTTVEEHVPKIAILPSLSPALEDVIVRSVVRRDLELTGLFDVIDDRKAPPGLYGFNDPVDIKAWQALGAEAIVKVAARNHSPGKVEVLGLAYFLNVGQDPVYEKKIVVESKKIRITAHRITDALLGALTGRPGGFASRFTFSGPWARNRRVFTIDSDGHGLMPQTDPQLTAIAPTWGPNQQLFYAVSTNYSPFRLTRLTPVETPHEPAGPPPALPKPTAISIPFRGSVYSVDFDKSRTRMAIAVAENGGSAIYVGNPDGTGLAPASDQVLANHPVFGPGGRLAYVAGGTAGQRVYVDGKAISPAGFNASAPTFCDTPNGLMVVFTVGVGGGRTDIVATNVRGGNLTRLTQNQGSNSYPACSPDGRLLAYFSTRQSDQGPGLYVVPLAKPWRARKISSELGESLRWDPLPEEMGPVALEQPSQTSQPSQASQPPQLPAQ